MIYCVSDLHGFPLERVLDGLRAIHFSDNKDFLFVLGDVIDRDGDGGVEMLRWMMEQPNVELLMGNHEAMMLSCEFAFQKITDELVDSLTQEQMGLLLTWMRNGGDVTIKNLSTLGKKDHDALMDLVDYVKDAPLYDTVSLDSGDFLLVHAGLGGFRPGKRMSEYSPDELLWTRPALDDRYFSNVMTILGHTPTAAYGDEYSGKIIRTDTWIDIDVKTTKNNTVALLRLDDLEVFYL